MLNKYKALTNYIAVTITTLLIVIVFTTLGNTKIWPAIGSASGTSTVALAGITFGFAILIIGLANALSSVLFADKSRATKTLLPLLITTLAMSALSAFITALFDKQLNGGFFVNIIINIIMWLILLITTPLLVIMIQDYNTKFIMSTVSENMAVEWEMNNFAWLFLGKVGVEHLPTHSILTYKDKKVAVKFVPQNVIERKIFLNGDLKNKEVMDLESRLEKDVLIGAIVFLSNTLPVIEGANTNIKVIRNNDLYNLLKEINNG